MCKLTICLLSLPLAAVNKDQPLAENDTNKEIVVKKVTSRQLTLTSAVSLGLALSVGTVKYLIIIMYNLHDVIL